MTATLPARVTVVEVGPRDGLQNEAAAVSADDKARFVEALADAGVPVVEAGAFVSPRWVPQMADSAAVFAAVRRHPGTRYAALIPNLTGFDRAMAAGVTDVAFMAAASETFSRRNANQSIDQALDTFASVSDRARAQQIPVRAYLSTAFGCPYEGAVPAARVAELCGTLLDLGAREVAISDTIGVAHPRQVWTLIDAVTARSPLDRLALHFHDTRGLALANVLAGLQAGVTTYDASCGGLGGCPYAPGASGNLATDDLVHLLDTLGIASGIDLGRLMGATDFIAARVGRPLPSRVYQAARAGR